MKRLRLKRTGPSGKYPWDRWLRRRKFRLEKGRNYACMTRSMDVQVRAAAIARGKRVSIRMFDDGVLIVTVFPQVPKGF